jgi:predicted acetyltransferase
LQSQGDNTKTITVALVKQYVLQHELNSHGLMVDALKNLLVMVEVNHVIVLVKNSKAQQEWKRITSKMDLWKRQKAKLCTQV